MDDIIAQNFGPQNTVNHNSAAVTTTTFSNGPQFVSRFNDEDNAITEENVTVDIVLQDEKQQKQQELDVTTVKNTEEETATISNEEPCKEIGSKVCIIEYLHYILELY